MVDSSYQEFLTTKLKTVQKSGFKIAVENIKSAVKNKASLFDEMPEM